jgi:hypothetical protein
MSIFVNNVAIDMFDPMVKQAYQSMGFKLRGTMRERTNVVGKTVKFPKIGKGIAKQKAIQDDVEPMNLTYSRPEVILQDWYASDYSDIFSQREINFDEIRELSEALGASIGRRADQLGIDALNASATTNVILSGATGFSFAKYLQMNKYFSKNNVAKGIKRYVAIDAEGEEDILNDDKFINNDFTQKRILDNGSTLDGLFMFGYNWIVFGDMDEGGIPVSGSTHTAFAWAQNAVGHAIGMDFSNEVNYIPEKTSFLATSKYKANAVSIDDEGIVKINYDV